MASSVKEEIQSLAFYDTLTHLPNRRLLTDRLEHALQNSERTGKKGALLFLDLDNFKDLNDSFGHDAGDALLKQVADRILSTVRKNDTVARLGGDEFVVLLEDLDSESADAALRAEVIAEKMLKVLNRPYSIDAHDHFNTASIGVSIFDGTRTSVEDLLKQADIAMYQSKKASRNTIRFFDPAMQDTVIERTNLERELRKGIAQNQLALYYQVQVDFEGRPLGAEALVRWHHPDRGIVSPLQFIPLAEESELIVTIGQWVIHTACQQLAQWQKSESFCDFYISVNVSAKQFHRTDFVPTLKACIEHYQINPSLLKLELTESFLLENIEESIATMNVLGKMGIRFALDDFGTGYSSLQYLKRLPLSELKIDRSFVREIARDNNDQVIVRTIIVMARTLNFHVIAEGVETEDQKAILLSSGCTVFQGYLFSQPVPIDVFETYLGILNQKL